MPTPVPHNPQAFSFYNGALHIRKDGWVLRIAMWPEPRAEKKRKYANRWEEFSPDFRLVKPYRSRKKPPKIEPVDPQLCFDFFGETVQQAPASQLPESQQKKRSFDSLRFSMPKEVARALEPFRTHQWPLLMLLRYDPGGIEMASSNPSLAYLLAQRMNSDRTLIESLQCCRMRQRDILEVIGLESSKRGVNLFQKLSPASLTGDNWEAVAQLLDRELRKAKSPLFHLPVINAGVVEILLNPTAAEAATPTLLEEVAEDRSENYRGRVVHLLTSTMNMQDELRCGKQWNRFPTVERLRDVHEQVSENYRRRIRQLMDVGEQGSHYFQNPPIPAIPGKIEPITSPAGLVDEGEEQGNCVASYASRVRDGRTFIYRVLVPQRATLSIIREGAGSDWEIGELETRFNTEAADETEAFVQAWLDRHRSVV